MPKHRTINIVVVGPGHGVGGTVTDKADRTITYKGQPVTVKI